jgi:hypothetical protein
MTVQWLAHFGLQSAPFSKEIDATELWLPSSRQHVIDELVDACTEHRHVLLTGEPGVGKTCVLRALKQHLPEAGFRLTYCHNATLGRRDFYRQLCLALGLSPKATAAAVFFEVSSHVQQLGEQRLHPDVHGQARRAGTLDPHARRTEKDLVHREEAATDEAEAHVTATRRRYHVDVGMHRARQDRDRDDRASAGQRHRHGVGRRQVRGMVSTNGGRTSRSTIPPTPTMRTGARMAFRHATRTAISRKESA